MAQITDRTVQPLGGNVTQAAAATLTSNATFAGNGVKVIGGGGSMSATVGLTASVTATVQVAAVLNAGTGMINDEGIAMRAGNSHLSVQSVLVAAGGLVTPAAADEWLIEVVLDAAGGEVYDVDADVFDLAVNLTVATPGRLEDGGTVTMSAETDMDTTTSPVFRLVLPTRKAVFTSHPLFRRFPIETGVTMLVTGGQVTLVESPSDTELKAADIYYLGGYRHQITPAERSVIVSAGYGDLIEEA